MRKTTKSRATLRGVLFHLLPAAVLAFLFAAVGVMHVTSRVLVVDAGYALSGLEQRFRELSLEQDRLKLELATLKSPNRLEKLAREQLGMGPPSADAVLSLPPAAAAVAQAQNLGPEAAPSEAGRQLARVERRARMGPRLR